MSPLKTAFLWVVAVILILVEMFVGYFGRGGDAKVTITHGSSPRGTGSGGAAGRRNLIAPQPDPLRNLEGLARLLLNSLADGKTVRQDDFEKQFGKGASEVLEVLQVTAVSRRGSRIEVSRGERTVKDLDGVQVTLSDRISFDAYQSAGKMQLKGIRGVKVDIGKGLPYLDVRQAVMSKDADGNTVVELKLELSRWLPYISYTVKIDPDGKIIR